MLSALMSGQGDAQRKKESTNKRLQPIDIYGLNARRYTLSAI